MNALKIPQTNSSRILQTGSNHSQRTNKHIAAILSRYPLAKVHTLRTRFIWGLTLFILAIILNTLHLFLLMGESQLFFRYIIPSEEKIQYIDLDVTPVDGENASNHQYIFLLDKRIAKQGLVTDQVFVFIHGESIKAEQDYTLTPVPSNTSAWVIELTPELLERLSINKDNEDSKKPEKTIKLSATYKHVITVPAQLLMLPFQLLVYLCFIIAFLFFRGATNNRFHIAYFDVGVLFYGLMLFYNLIAPLQGIFFPRAPNINALVSFWMSLGLLYILPFLHYWVRFLRMRIFKKIIGLAGILFFFELIIIGIIMVQTLLFLLQQSMTPLGVFMAETMLSMIGFGQTFLLLVLDLLVLSLAGSIIAAHRVRFKGYYRIRTWIKHLDFPESIRR